MSERLWEPYLNPEELAKVLAFETTIKGLREKRRELARQKHNALEVWDRRAAAEFSERIASLDRHKRALCAERQVIVNRGSARRQADMKRAKDAAA